MIDYLLEDQEEVIGLNNKVQHETCTLISNSNKLFYENINENIISSELLHKLQTDFTTKLLDKFDVKERSIVADLNFNEKGKLNSGDICKCSISALKHGINHNVFEGETELNLIQCDLACNNKNLFCYELTISPHENFKNRDPTVIPYNQQEYTFDGFLILSHFDLSNIPPLRFVRYNIDYIVNLAHMTVPENFVIKDLILFETYLFKDILNLFDWEYHNNSLAPTHDEMKQCSALFHFMPKFSRIIKDKAQEILPMNVILNYLITNFKPLFDENNLDEVQNMPFYDWDRFVQKVKNSIVVNPAKKPRGVRLDQIDRIDQEELAKMANPVGMKGLTQEALEKMRYPKIIHFGLKPLKNNFARSPKYQKLLRQYLKLKHLISNKAIVTSNDYKRLNLIKNEMGEMKESLIVNNKKYLTVSIESHGYYTTGIKTDLVQYALVLPMLTLHFRYHKSLQIIQNKLEYQFKDPLLLQKAMTHPSFKPNYGMNPDQCRNTLSNCGLRNPVYAKNEKKIIGTRKRGIITLNKIMKLKGGMETNKRRRYDNREHYSRHRSPPRRDSSSGDYNRSSSSRDFNRSFSSRDYNRSSSYYGTHSSNHRDPSGDYHNRRGQNRREYDENNNDSDDSKANSSGVNNNDEEHTNYNQTIIHNERLEFLGDAIIEFLTSVHLFFMFPHIEEGGLAVYRASLVQNAHLALLAKQLELEKYMLYAHGPDLCHETDLKHAMSNAFEALMGAIFLDGSLKIADKILGKCLFGDDYRLYDVWTNLSPHPLQQDQPDGDREWIPKVPLLQKLTQFEGEIGVEFRHIRLLARAFTLRNTGFNNLTLGHNQRLEFLGDTILQIITSEYLYKHFPYHHEGHLSLLRSCLVNNQTQCEVCNDLSLQRFVISNIQPIDLTTKDKADLLESFLGSLFVDQGLEPCKVVFKVCFISKLDDFIENQGWNDPKSLLQQCCLTLRKMDGKEPDVPIYKVIDCIGPSNTRRYKVGVYFRDNRLAEGWGRSKQQAEMEAAEAAIEKYKSVFPQFTHRKKK